MRKLPLPVFSPTYNVPGAYALEFTAAVRYEVFENNNTNVAVPKFGMRWQPFDETFTVRATWGEGFREPSLIELYASPTSGLVGSTDILPTSLGGPATPVGDPIDVSSQKRRWLSPVRPCSSRKTRDPSALALSGHPNGRTDLRSPLTSGISSRPVSSSHRPPSSISERTCGCGRYRGFRAGRSG